MGFVEPMHDRAFYNTVGLAAAAIVLVSFGIGYLGASLAPHPVAAAPNGGSTGAAGGAPEVIYLTINANPDTGLPQYTPANFSVPLGVVHFVITNYDTGDLWSGCTCQVTGTVGNVEQVNGASLSSVSNTDVSHTFTVPALGVNVLVPGMSTVSFAISFSTPGYVHWLCNVPCGAGDNPSTSDPMGDAGYMAGTITVG